MSAQRRQKRLPISCDPCRLRKIRCSRPRGPPPCETCVRRHLESSCLYAGRHETLSISPRNVPPSPVSEHSASTLASSQSNERLATRVANLEALVQAQAAHNLVHDFPTPPSPPAVRIKGVLSTSDKGHVRFIPSSTAISNPQQATCRSIDLASGPYPLGKRQVDTSHLLVDLPPRHHCKQLKDVFFESFAPLFHILHDPTFNRQYSEFEQAPESMPLSWLALLYAILGTSVIALGPSSALLDDLSRRGSVTEQIAELSERYRNAAFKCLEADNYLWQQNVTTLQALIILIYGINHSHGQMWTLLGMTYHIALSLGCHVDPCEFGLDNISSEERRRCWAAILMLYMIQNMTMGHLGPNPSDAAEGVRMPLDLNDSDLVATDYVLPPSSSRATQMSYLLLKFRLYHISNEVSSLVRHTPQPAPSLINKLDKSLVDEQRSWHEKYLVHLSSAILPTYHEVHFHILQGYSHQLMLLLHNHVLRTLTADSPQYSQSAAKSLNSAKELLHIHAVFFTQAHFSPFSWYLRGICSFHAYHAAVSLLAMLADHPSDETYGDIVPLVQRCAERFETLAQASVICKKAVPTLRDMLNVVETWSLHLGQPSLEGIPVDDRNTHGQLRTSTEPSGSADWSRDGFEFNVPGESVQNFINSITEDFDPQFWLTSFGKWS